MEALQKKIEEKIHQIIPDADKERVKRVVTHLTSNEIGVRTLDRLYDVEVNDIVVGGLSKCDAVRLHREWQSKYSKLRLT